MIFMLLNCLPVLVLETAEEAQVKPQRGAAALGPDLQELLAILRAFRVLAEVAQLATRFRGRFKVRLVE